MKTKLLLVSLLVLILVGATHATGSHRIRAVAFPTNAAFAPGFQGFYAPQFAPGRDCQFGPQEFAPIYQTPAFQFAPTYGISRQRLFAPAPVFVAPRRQLDIAVPFFRFRSFGF